MSPPRIVAQKQFVVEASPPRVWDLLGTVVYQSLPLEKVDIVSTDSFRAVLKWPMGFVTVPFDVKGKLVGMSRPASFGSVICVKWGLVRLGVKVNFTLKPVAESKTEVLCTAMEEGKRTVMGWILSGQQRSFAGSMFDSIRARLQQLCQCGQD